MKSLSQKYEENIRAAGFARVCGIDEVGRGAWAGPIVAAGVIFDIETKIPGINDSKKLTEAQRIELAGEIKSKAAAYCIKEVGSSEIDLIGVGKANERVIKMVAEELMPDYCLIDQASVHALPMAFDLIIKGDSKVFSIAAASILAKVYRDNLMSEMDREYPGYGFADHKGYGTKDHQAALLKLGHCAIHRLSYQPLLQPKLF